MAITEQQIDDALAALDRGPNGEYILPMPWDGQNWVDEPTARAAVRTCLVLGVAPTGVVVQGAEIWTALTTRVEAIESRLDALEA